MISIWLPVAPLLTALPLLGTGEDPPAPPVELRMYDLSAMLGEMREFEFGERLYPMNSTREVDAVEAEFKVRAEPDDVAVLVRAALPAEFEYEDRLLHVQGDHLFVAAPASVQDRVASFVAALEGCVGAATTVTLDVIALDGGSEHAAIGRSVVGELEASQLIETLSSGARFHQSFSVHIEPGRTSMLDMTRQVQLVTEYDVQVAQGAFAFDPVLEELAVGTRLFARGTPIDGGLSLSLVLRSGEMLADPYERELRSGGMLASEGRSARVEVGAEVFQAASVLGHNFALDTVLPDGGALVIEAELDIAGAESRRVIVLRRTGPSLSAQKVVDLGEGWSLRATNLEAGVPPAVRTQGWPMDGDHAMPTTLKADRWEPGYLASIGGRPSLVGPLEAGSTEGGTTAVIGPWLVEVGAEMSGEAPLVWTRSTDIVELEFTLHARGDDPHEAARVSLPVRAGEEASAVLGVEGHAISDYDVEIAQYSAAADPMGSLVFDGVLLRVRTSRLADGRLALEVRARGHLRAEEQFQARLGARMFDAVELNSFDRLFIDERVVVDGSGSGASLVFGDASGGAEGSLALELRVR